jgi:MFS family permease
LFAATVLVGELGCLGSAFVTSYPQLYVCRVLTGISVGGALPVIYSVLGDIYPANKRSAISAVVTTGTGIGAGIGQVIAGSMTSWRLPFIIVAVPGLICSVLLLGIEDPERGANEAAVIERQQRAHSQTEEASHTDDDCTLDQGGELEIDHTVQVEAEDRSVSCKGTIELMKIPTVVLVILQAAPGALPFGFVATFLNDFLQEVST